LPGPWDVQYPVTAAAAAADGDGAKNGDVGGDAIIDDAVIG